MKNDNHRALEVNIFHFLLKFDNEPKREHYHSSTKEKSNTEKRKKNYSSNIFSTITRLPHSGNTYSRYKSNFLFFRHFSVEIFKNR